jgi:hypothetical protein
MNSTFSNTKLVERSVSNLQTLYTVVVGLALVKALQTIFFKDANLESMRISWAYLPALISLVVTMIPFYHGACRYLDETYICKRKQESKLGGLIDFIFFFCEGSIFYILALSLEDPLAFFRWWLILLLMDIIWLVFVFFNANNVFKKIKSWFWLNLASGLVVFAAIASKFFKEDINEWIILTAFLLVRSVLDYSLAWLFYWPSYDSSDESSRAESD